MDLQEERKISLQLSYNLTGIITGCVDYKYL